MTKQTNGTEISEKAVLKIREKKGNFLKVTLFINQHHTFTSVSCVSPLSKWLAMNGPVGSCTLISACVAVTSRDMKGTNTWAPILLLSVPPNTLKGWLPSNCLCQKSK